MDTQPIEPTSEKEHTSPNRPTRAGLKWGAVTGLAAGLAANLCLAGWAAGYTVLADDGGDAAGGFVLIALFGSVVAGIAGTVAGGFLGLVLAAGRSEHNAPLIMAIAAGTLPAVVGLTSWLNALSDGDNGSTVDPVFQLGAILVLIAVFAAIGYQAGAHFANKLTNSSPSANRS